MTRLDTLIIDFGFRTGVSVFSRGFPSRRRTRGPVFPDPGGEGFKVETEVGT